MPAVQAAALRGSLSGGALIALSLGLGLYQMTSLVVGTANERVLPLSMQIPTVDVDRVADPIESELNVVLGTRFVANLPSITWPHISSAHSSVSLPARVASSVLPGPATAPKPTATPLPAPVVKAPTSLYHDADERSPRLARRR
jgi:hypothetical protein